MECTGLVESALIIFKGLIVRQDSPNALVFALEDEMSTPWGLQLICRRSTPIPARPEATQNFERLFRYVKEK